MYQVGYGKQFNPFHWNVGIPVHIKKQKKKMMKKNWNINLKEMVRVGVHFGHETKKWNPKMAPYIFKERQNSHIISLTYTAHFLSEACDFLFDGAKRGK